MNYVFIMDPLETVAVSKDTSFIFMVGAARRGHRVFFVPAGGMSLLNGKVIFNAEPVTPDPAITDKTAGPFVRGKIESLSEDDVDAVFIRTEPPFDHRYLMDTWLVDHLSSRIPIINSPHGLRTCNEKLWATRFTELVPPTLVTRDRKDYEAFLSEHESVIVKPTDGFGGLSVFLVSKGDPNAIVAFETLSIKETKHVIVQKYIPQATTGDKRILLLNGEFLAAVLRVQMGEDHRNNFFAGGRPAATDLTDRERHIIETIGPALVELGIYFAGIDVIGDYLIEVNVTSPTCIQEANRLYGLQLEDDVIEFVETLVENDMSNTTAAPLTTMRTAGNDQ